MHLLIPFACSTAPGCLKVLESLQLPHLEKLLSRLAPVDSDTGADTSLTPPHERALARLQGLTAPDGCIPWAAHEAARSGRAASGEAWAWITPVHWDVGADHITMTDPRALDLQEAESRELLLAMQAFFAGDGIALEYAAPHRWLARGVVFEELASASLDRVAGRDIGAWMPSVPGLRRLQNEMQMLLYTHPVNDARGERKLAAVNSFWVSGTGRLPPGVRPTAAGQIPTQGSDAPPGAGGNGDGMVGVVVADALRAAALRNDWAAWAQSWIQLDRGACQNLLRSAGSGNDPQLTLCGERTCLYFAAARDGVLPRLRRRFKRTRLQDLQEQL